MHNAACVQKTSVRTQPKDIDGINCRTLSWLLQYKNYGFSTCLLSSCLPYSIFRILKQRCCLKANLVAMSVNNVGQNKFCFVLHVL